MADERPEPPNLKHYEQVEFHFNGNKLKSDLVFGLDLEVRMMLPQEPRQL
jgi:hypothetical protein